MKSPFALEADKIIQDTQFFIDTYAGDDFLQDVACFLSNSLDITYALVGYVDDNPEYISTAALALQGKPAGKLTYTMRGTPCDNVVGKNSCFYPSNVQRLFPEDKELQELNAESYYGSPLVDENKKPLGLIALLDTKRMVQGSLLEKVLRIVTPKTQEALSDYLRKNAQSS